MGLRTRRTRAALSALGIAIGVAAIVAVLGLSSSSQSGLLEEIDRLGTNLLIVTNGQSFAGKTAELPLAAPAMIARIYPVEHVAETGKVSGAVYRSPLIPSVDTNALAVEAASLNLVRALNITVTQGSYLNAATANEPVAVLGPAAARPRHGPHLSRRAHLARRPVVLPGRHSRLVHAHAGTRKLRARRLPRGERISASTGTPTPSTCAPRTAGPSRPVRARHHRRPRSPQRSRRQPTLGHALARADAQSAFNGLFLGLGAVALLVGAVGVANIMVISVLERRSEIGLRRALGATKGQIRIQFLSEAILLSLAGGAVGIAAGILATAVYAATKHWTIVIPTLAWAGGFGAAILIGAIAGLLPAIRAARLSPTEALRTV